MELKVIAKESLLSFVNRLLEDREVVGVRKREDGKYIFDRLENSEELCLNYDVTLLPPKKYFLPQRETLIRFEDKEGELSVEAVVESSPRVIIGVHPYDMAAINLLDKVFSRDKKDANYLKKREDTLIIGTDVKNPSPYAFYESVGSDTREGFDLFFTEMGKSYVVETGSQKGEELLKYGDFKKATAREENEFKNIKKQRKGLSLERRLNFLSHDLPHLLGEKLEHPVWEEKSSRCLSCGSCIMVCPTCYCFDVQDEMDMSLTAGERFRQWDGCLLTDFARVATGENFRKDIKSRYQHRFYRKGKYIPEKFGMIGCVGCGRCASACLADIADPVEIYNALL
ncbi:MAG: 4Fe-4S dicluster domain-containing protein [Syntrophales bacterium]